MERRSRRGFLKGSAAGAGAMIFSGAVWQNAAFAAPAQLGTSPYGALQAADANGIMLPPGFTSQVVARSGQVVSGTSYTWHDAPDGGACFADGTGWIYVSNSEVSSTGGVGMIRFNSSGQITAASRLLSGSNRNCAGGTTPWNTWLSCEEVSNGRVWETYPFGGTAVARLAMGRFNHEAAAADPVRRVVYMTEDATDGCFYRFVPTTWGDLSAGTLQVLVAGTATSGSFTWANVPDPDGSPTATRSQVSGAKKFNGGEGVFYAEDTVWFTTKGDNRVWKLNVSAGTYELAYDDGLVTNGTAPLTGVDNITRSTAGDLYIAEDGGNMEICMITSADQVSVFLRITGHSGSEITGPAFNPAGNRLYFSSQRGTTNSSSAGITYCVTGPFRT